MIVETLLARQGSVFSGAETLLSTSSVNNFHKDVSLANFVLDANDGEWIFITLFKTTYCRGNVFLNITLLFKA